jgi:hypothetical protein
MQNRELLEAFVEKGTINIHRGKLFDRQVKPKPADFDFDRVAGMSRERVNTHREEVHIRNTGDRFGVLSKRRYLRWMTA